jgi:hypothetical protein
MQFDKYTDLGMPRDPTTERGRQMDDNERVEGDSADIILNVKARRRGIPAAPPPPPPQDDDFKGHEEEPVTPEKKRKKLEAAIAAANVMGKNLKFPEEVRRKFLSKAEAYQKELSLL